MANERGRTTRAPAAAPRWVSPSRRR